MRFTNKDGSRFYGLEFQRFRPDIPVPGQPIKEDGEIVTEPAKHFYTTVNLLEFDPALIRREEASAAGGATKEELWELAREIRENATIVATATVGAWKKEPKVSAEKGRLRALRNLVRTVDKELRPLIFRAYFNRLNG